MSELDKQAYPAAPNSWGDPVLGLTIRQHAAITLRVPMSGDPELDAMIREARRMDAAEKIAAAMVSSIDSEDNYDRLRNHAASLGMKVSRWIAADAIKQADALLAASEPKKAEPRDDGNTCTKCGHWNGGPVLCEHYAEEAERRERERQAQPEPECRCDMRTKLVGDGCEVCNPELAKELSEPQPDAEGWIEWKGGECPVHPEAMVMVRFRDGWEDKWLAGSMRWNHSKSTDDIIAYRVVK